MVLLCPFTTRTISSDQAATNAAGQTGLITPREVAGALILSGRVELDADRRLPGALDATSCRFPTNRMSRKRIPRTRSSTRTPTSKPSISRPSMTYPENLERKGVISRHLSYQSPHGVSASVHV
jgi:hypothetical protein